MATQSRVPHGDGVAMVGNHGYGVAMAAGESEAGCWCPSESFGSEREGGDWTPRPSTASFFSLSWRKLSSTDGSGSTMSGSLSMLSPSRLSGSMRSSWPKTGRYVYVPYYISPDYTQQERGVILAGLQSFHQSTCVRFVPWTQTHRDYLHFLSGPGEGCKSFIGRQHGGQGVFLEKKGCLYQSTVQHEVLHALGFHHEQVRSDRDQYVRILSQNVQPVPTNNLLTPYDFSSVMHYGKYDFSSNGLPTIVAKHNHYLDFGHAHQMSPNDITRVNRLYGCRVCTEEPEFIVI
ncbi:unnamed protein product [Menidia menidia]|uniref:Metalloendopeptidase n=1 Tax=Menidia menidia TaxID=238744 RepID=A0A8S4A535_9TELE|nr:unnamed protein product [Menidia menidia]